MAIQSEVSEISTLQLDSFTKEVMLMQTCCLHTLYEKLQIFKQSIKKTASLLVFKAYLGDELLKGGRPNRIQTHVSEFSKDSDFK